MSYVPTTLRSKFCEIVSFEVSTSISRAHDRGRLSPGGVQPSSRESQRRPSAHIASWTRASPVSSLFFVPGCGALGGTAVSRIAKFCWDTSTRPGGTPVIENSVKVLVGPLPTVTMNWLSVGASDWTGCTEKRVGSGPKLMDRAGAPLTRSVLFKTQYWTPRYNGLEGPEEQSFADRTTTRALMP